MLRVTFMEVLMNTRLLGIGLVLITLAAATTFALAASAPAPVSVIEVPQLARAYPGWSLVNPAGFGDANNAISAMAVFNGKIYAGTSNDNGAGLWASLDGHTWTPVSISGWTTATTAVMYLTVYGGRLYLGTFNPNGAEIWRSDGATWERVVQGGLGNAANVSVSALVALGGNLYAVVGNYVAATDVWSLNLWRSASGAMATWQPVALGNTAGVWPDVAVDVYGGYLYLGFSRVSHAELWRSNNGTNWTPVLTSTQTASNTHVLSMAEFGGYFYIGLRNMQTGGQIWRTTNGTAWTPVVSSGIGKQQNRGAYGLFVYNGKLYVVMGNFNTGAEVWRSSNGIGWEQAASGGWGSGAVRYADYFDRSAVIFNNRLYIGTFDGPGGGEIWKKTITARFTANVTTGGPPLTVHFTNTSAGDYTTSTWNFGDGATSTEQNPSHTYAAIGTYTVTLTVGDGVETNTATYPSYIRTRYRLFAPIIVSD
jgi:PKD repeat protein